MKMLEAAHTWLKSGFATIPVRTDGTKRPVFDWSRFQSELPKPAALDLWWSENPNLGVGIVCGAVSGNLEMLEFEGRTGGLEVIPKILEAISSESARETLAAFLDYGYVEHTPSGGLHFLYRIADHPVPGNTKIANRPSTPQELEVSPKQKIQTLAETRGEGGFVVVAPSGGNCHQSGRPWSVLDSSEIGWVPTISWEDRCAIHEAIREVLDETPDQPIRPPKSATEATGDRPGDEFNAQVSWEEILEPHGWTVSHQIGIETYWVRPGKNKRAGCSATTGKEGSGAQDRLYVFSSSTEFDTEVPYTKFAAYALLEHNNDFAAASRELRKRGYGGPSRFSSSVPPTSRPMETPTSVPGELVEEAKTLTLSGRGWLPVQADPAMLAFIKQDDVSFSESFAKTFMNRFRAVDGKTWMFWDGKTWKVDGSRRVDGAIISYTSAMLDVAKDLGEDGAELAKWTKRLRGAGKFLTLSKVIAASPDAQIDLSELDADERRHLITCENGVLDLDTMQLLGHQPEQLLTRQVQASYRPEAEAPRFTRFLEEVLPDREMRDYVQRAIGYTLSGDADRRAMFLCHGPSGTGKSQFINTMLGIFGDFGATAASDTFRRKDASNGPSTNLHMLRGRRFVSLTELDADERFDESLLKKVTGRDPVTTRELYDRPMTWMPEFTAWVATNHLPRLSVEDDAIWKRVKPIAFNQVFVDDESTTEHDLASKMLADERDGIFAWAVEGYLKYLKLGLGEPSSVTQSVADYRQTVDVVAQFLVEAEADSVIQVEGQARIGVRQLHRIYVEWSQRNMLRPLGERKFTDRVESVHGFRKERTDQGYSWFGIGAGSHGILGTFNAAAPPRRW